MTAPDRKTVAEALECYRTSTPVKRDNCRNTACPYNRNDPEHNLWCCGNLLMVDAIKLLKQEKECV